MEPFGTTKLTFAVMVPIIGFSCMTALATQFAPWKLSFEENRALVQIVMKIAGVSTLAMMTCLMFEFNRQPKNLFEIVKISASTINLKLDAFCVSCVVAIFLSILFSNSLSGAITSLYGLFGFFLILFQKPVRAQDLPEK